LSGPVIVSTQRREFASAARRGSASEADGRQSGPGGELADSLPERGPDWTRPPAADLEPLKAQAARAQLEIEPGLARPHEGGRVPPGALHHPAAAERRLKGEQPATDLFDQPARAAKVDRPLPAFFAVDQPIIRPIGLRPAAAPRGHDRSLPREEVRPHCQQGQGGMRVLVSALAIFQFLPPLRPPSSEGATLKGMVPFS
jgi:hypothetical protein